MKRKKGPNDMFHIVSAIGKCFIIIILFFIPTNLLTNSNDLLKLRRYLPEATTKRTGPNDMLFHVIWAISKSFFLLFLFSISTNLLTDSNDILKLWIYLHEATTKRTGPNDVVWAISKCFFIVRVFYIS